MKQCHTDSQIKIQLIDIRTPKGNSKQMNKQNFIQVKIEKLRNKELSNFEFLKIICHKNQPINAEKIKNYFIIVT